MSNPVNVQKESGTNISAGVLQVTGTTTNDDAAVGVVGEYVDKAVAQGAAIPLTNGQPANVTSISLTAGDWDVWALAAFVQGAGNAVLQAIASVSATSATTGVGAIVLNAPTTSALVNCAQAVPARRFSLSTTTTIYLVAETYFGGGTFAGFGGIFARRVR